MTAFLSDEWFADLEARAAAATSPPALELVLEQRVDGDPGHRWQVRIADGRVEIARTALGDADVRIDTDETTATGIHAGEISAQRAFLDGRLRIGGDVQALMEHREALADLGLGLG